jgi:hypothetical protein
MQRVIAYIDGYNLYHGLRDKKWKWAYWLNLQALMECFLHGQEVLVKTKYFTSVVKDPPDKRARQAVFLEALQTLENFEIFYGHFLSDPVTCYRCGRTYTTHHEKMTDVNIATELLVDTYADQFEKVLLVTADSDLSAPVKVIRKLFPDRRVIVLFPPARSSKQLMKLASGFEYISRNRLVKSLFPGTIIKPDGYKLIKPTVWK